MKITAIELTNIRRFKKLNKIDLSETINIFIGANNAGKSTILSSIFLIQRNGVINNNDVTIGEKLGEVNLYFSNHDKVMNLPHPTVDRIKCKFPGSHLTFENDSGYSVPFKLIASVEPFNLIYPYLSKRKTLTYHDQINENNTNSVVGNFQFLFSKIDRLVTPQFQPGNSYYLEACKNILGFEISTLASENGKKAVYYIHNTEHIPLTSMGEGVANILGLITDLCVAENKIFLIEEPENDIHPTALKALLKLIVEKSATNQFFISTHSNIVMKYLGAVTETKIFNITNELSDPKRPKLFVSNLQEVRSAEERRIVLESLGYEFYDFDLWKYWLFLEESSAEMLIRYWFIKWFVPGLNGKIRTFSTNSLSKVVTKFEDFNNLFVFLHLEPVYKNKVWVIIDDGVEEKAIIDNLKNLYCKNGWKEDNFSQFSEHDFEKFYPERFNVKVDSVLKETDKQKKRKAKKILLNEVLQWITENEKTAKEEFKISADSVIAKLKEIAKQI